MPGSLTFTFSFFLSVRMCVCLGLSLQRSEGAGFLWSKTTVVVSHLKWVLGTEIGSSTRAVCALNSWAVSSSPPALTSHLLPVCVSHLSCNFENQAWNRVEQLKPHGLSISAFSEVLEPLSASAMDLVVSRFPDCYCLVLETPFSRERRQGKWVPERLSFSICRLSPSIAISVEELFPSISRQFLSFCLELIII